MSVRAPAAIALLALSACGGTGEELPRSGSMSLEHARSFVEFPLVFAGERVEGLPLTAIVRRRDTADYVSFIYGDCSPGEDGCAPPAEIQVWRASARRLDAYELATPGGVAPGPTTLRGVPAAFVRDGQLELYTPRSTIVVFAASRARVLAIAESLRCVTSSGPSADTATLVC